MKIGICVQATRLARVCLEESMKYAFKRETFGKPLIEHPVIRLKLAHMSRQVEATQVCVWGAHTPSFHATTHLTQSHFINL